MLILIIAIVMITIIIIIASVINFNDYNCSCNYSSTGGHFSFEDFVAFQIQPNFSFGLWTIVHGNQKIKSKRISFKNLCNCSV